ncbi:MAG: bifunctional UDP-N-acetylglucosamine diphosphorylase/glucosamine-1-phosphate N-acetyltransferase GlmU, partial [Pseudomonadota bacterium]
MFPKSVLKAVWPIGRNTSAEIAMASGTTCIILAAGKGSRMHSATHKVLHHVAGRSLLDHVLATTEAIGADQVVVVVGAQRSQVEHAIRGRSNVTIAHQAEQLGTGHAVLAARDALKFSSGETIIMYGDVPFVSGNTITRLRADAASCSGVAILGFDAEDPGQYGRIIATGVGTVERIVEYRDATSQERAIKFCNSGIIAASTPILFELLSQVTNDNAAGEFYLTDIVGLARSSGIEARATIASENEVLGVNSRLDLAAAEAAFQQRIRGNFMADGVTLQAPKSVHFCYDTVIAADVIIEPNVVFGPGVVIQAGARIRAFSHLEGCVVGAGAVIGPYARLRPGANIGVDAKIGNFVEIKNASLGPGAKANHLSYVGDATVGQGANIGAGTITCNYDGYFKHQTHIGEGAFIGSNSALVAPVDVGDNAIVAAGSTITQSVDAGSLALTRAE